jgi:hypothetical protein
MFSLTFRSNLRTMLMNWMVFMRLKEDMAVDIWR